MASMCDTCHAGCCRAYNLLVTVFDALKISQDLGMPIGEFVTLLPQDAEGAKRLGDRYRAIRFSDPGFENTYFYLALKRVESRLVPGTVKCFFLQEWARVDPVQNRGSHPGSKVLGRCGIYGSRPLMCRAYPSTLALELPLGFVSNPSSPELLKVNPIYSLCPEKWEVSSANSDHSQTMHNLVLNRYETEFHNKVVEEWNTKPNLLKNFFPFAIGCYASRLRVAPEMVTTPDVMPKPARGTEFEPEPILE